MKKAELLLIVSSYFLRRPLQPIIHWETLIQTRCFKSYNLVAAQPPQVAAYNWDLVPEIGIETATLQFEIIIAINISITLKASISF